MKKSVSYIKKCVHILPNISRSKGNQKMKRGQLIEYKRVLTREISSRDETRVGMKSSLSMVKCLLLFTLFCPDEISSRNELISVKKTRIKFHSGMKKRRKKIWKHFILGQNFKMNIVFFFNFWRRYLNMLSKVNMFEYNECIDIIKHKASL